LDGDVQTKGATIDYLETNSLTVTFNNALVTGQKVSFIWSQTAGTAGVNAGTVDQLAYYAASGGIVSGSPVLTASSGVLTSTADSLSNRHVLTDADGQKFFIATNDSPTAGQVIISINRNPVTGVFTKTGQAASFIQMDSLSGEGSTRIRASATDNTTPTVVAIFKESGVSIKGTTTNDSATAGNVGEYVGSSVLSIAAPTSGNWGDLTSISLTTGDWDVTMTGWGNTGVVANVTTMQMGLSTTSGNSSTGLTPGWNQVGSVGIGTASMSYAISRWRLSVNTTTTVYLKYEASYSGTAPGFHGTVLARRER
jgi:hypothetical protein